MDQTWVSNYRNKNLHSFYRHLTAWCRLVAEQSICWFVHLLGTAFTNAHRSTVDPDTGTCMCVSPPTRNVSGKVHPLSVFLRSVSDAMSWIIWLVANLSPRRSRSVPGYSVRHLLWIRWHWNRFSPRTSVSPRHFQSTNASYSYVIDLRPMLHNFSNSLHH